MGLLKKMQSENPDAGWGTSDDAPEVPPSSSDSFSSPAPGSARQFPRATNGGGGVPGTEKAAATDGSVPATDDARYREQMQGLADMTAALNGKPAPGPVRFSTDAKADTTSDEASMKKDPEDPATSTDHDVPPELQALYALLSARDWSVEQSPDPVVRARSEMAWNVIEGEILNAVDAGYGVEVHRLWRRFAPTEHQGLSILLARGRTATDALHDQPFSDGYTRPEWASRPQFHTDNSNQVLDQHLNHQQQQMHGDGASAGSVDIFSKILSAPFALTAAAGSLVMNSLKAIGGKAKSYYEKDRINGHSILAAQLNQNAAEIASLTTSLKKRGMDDLIREMRATGRPAREVCEGMKPGGPYQHLSERYNTLMDDKDFAKEYSRLQEVLDEFDFNASRYAAAGVELNLDYSDAIDRNLEAISASTEGIIFKKDGAIKHLQELARQIGERISDLVNSLMGRLKPQ